MARTSKASAVNRPRRRRAQGVPGRVRARLGLREDRDGGGFAGWRLRARSQPRTGGDHRSQGIRARRCRPAAHELGPGAILRSAEVYDLATPLDVRREHAVIDDEVDVGARNECGELFEELQRLKSNVARPIAPWRLELHEHASHVGSARATAVSTVVNDETAISMGRSDAEN